jgi:hypothetical protein
MLRVMFQRLVGRALNRVYSMEPHITWRWIFTGLSLFWALMFYIMHKVLIKW